MTVAKRQILVTSALPYASGPLHMGHILEHVQTDIWVRYQRLRGHKCSYVCAVDGHGTATMLGAEELGTSPETIVAKSREEQIRDFQGFHVHHDNYHSTHSEENRLLSEEIYARCQRAGRIFSKEVRRPYDEVKKMFLADRFVRGNCPRCDAPDQYGDSCEVCGATYEVTALRNPISTLSGSVPATRSAEHLFFDLPALANSLRDWIHSGVVHPAVANKLNEWLNTGLIPWDISRDPPYFGFHIPGTKDKFFYVWVDAPIGYIASFQDLCARHPDLSFEDYWDADKAAAAGTEVHHFIGKDIIYFHALFWPAMLKCAGLRTPTRIHTHGFLTLENTKMSKSRGFGIGVRDYLDRLDAEYLRYYFAARLTPRIEDINMDLEDFAQRVNSDLVGKVVNIASRCAGFIQNLCAGMLAAELPRPDLWRQATERSAVIAEHFEAADFAAAVREVMQLADLANQYIQQQRPWSLPKSEADRIQAICTQGLNQFLVLIIYLQPVLPELARKVEHFLDIKPLTWTDLQRPLLNCRIRTYKPLLTRVDRRAVQALAPKGPESKPEKDPDGGAEGIISIDDFARIDLRVARITKAEIVPKADKLLRLTLDLGDASRTVFAGIKSAYAPAELEGRLTVLVANLEPRKMRFGLSEGMILAAGPGGENIFLLQPDAGAKPGMRIR